LSQGPTPNRIIYCATTAFTPTYMADLTTQDRMLGHASAAMPSENEKPTRQPGAPNGGGGACGSSMGNSNKLSIENRAY